MRLSSIKPGNLVTEDGKTVWRIIGIATSPTVELENLETKKRVNIVIGSRIDQFKKLIIDEKS